jgi:hypothetical protein
MVDTLSLAALDGLTAALTSLLPPAADPALQPALLVQPRRLVPAGIGGFVGVNDDPHGEILGRRLEATAVVTVKASGDALDGAVAAVSRALLAADRAALRGAGILRLALGEVGPKPAAPGQATAERDLAFDVLYEFLKLPEADEGVIQEIPIELDVAQPVAAPYPLPRAARRATPPAVPRPAAPRSTRQAAKTQASQEPRQRDQSEATERARRAGGNGVGKRGAATARTRRRGGTPHG